MECVCSIPSPQPIAHRTLKYKISLLLISIIYICGKMFFSHSVGWLRDNEICGLLFFKRAVVQHRLCYKLGEKLIELNKDSNHRLTSLRSVVTRNVINHKT